MFWWEELEGREEGLNLALCRQAWLFLVAPPGNMLGCRSAEAGETESLSSGVSGLLGAQASKEAALTCAKHMLGVWGGKKHAHRSSNLAEALGGLLEVVLYQLSPEA